MTHNTDRTLKIKTLVETKLNQIDSQHVGMQFKIQNFQVTVSA